MRLNELDPRWVIKDGVRVGFIFRSPTNTKWYQFCKFVVLTHKEQWALTGAALGSDLPEDWAGLPPVQIARDDVCWTCQPDPQTSEFDQLTITPSIDGSAGGLWHGWIRNGQIA